MLLKLAAIALVPVVVGTGLFQFLRPPVGKNIEISEIDRGPGNSGHLISQVDPKGRIHLIWVQYGPGGAWRLNHSRQDDALSGWTEPQEITVPGNSAYAPHVDFDSEGNAVVVWVQDAQASNVVVSRQLDTSGKLGPVTQVDRDRGDQRGRLYSGAYDPRVYFNPITRKWLAIWSQWDGWADRIFFNERTETGAWGPSAPVDAGRSDGYWPWMCVGPTGETLAVWYQLDWTKGHLASRPFASLLRVDGSWTPAADISGDKSDGSWARVICDGRRGFHVFWHQSDGVMGYRLWGAEVSTKGEFAADRVLFESASFRRTIVSPVAIARTPAQTTLLSWCGEIAGKQVLYAAEWDSANKAPPRVDTMPLQAGTCIHPSTSVAADGRRLVVWTEEGAQTTRIRGFLWKQGAPSTTKPVWQKLLSPGDVTGGAGLIEIASLDNETGPLHPTDNPVPPRFTQHVRPLTAIDAKDRFWIFWVGKHDGRHRLFAARMESGSR
jgi:hypothetical protein